MNSGSTNDDSKQDANSGAGAAPRRPHWRQRDRTATTVCVVHPAQFRSVVQQLTGAPPAEMHHVHGGGVCNTGGSSLVAASASAATAANAAAPAMAAQCHGRGQGQQEMNSSGNIEQRTLARMRDECMAWADGC